MNKNIIITIALAFVFLVFFIYSFQELKKEEFSSTVLEFKETDTSVEKEKEESQQEPISIELKKPPFIK